MVFPLKSLYLLAQEGQLVKNRSRTHCTKPSTGGPSTKQALPPSSSARPPTEQNCCCRLLCGLSFRFAQLFSVFLLDICESFFAVLFVYLIFMDIKVLLDIYVLSMMYVYTSKYIYIFCCSKMMRYKALCFGVLLSLLVQMLLPRCCCCCCPPPSCVRVRL